MPLSDSPIQMPADKFTADQKGHRANNQAIEQFGNLNVYGQVPLGTILPYIVGSGTTAPPGYKKCDGSAVSRTTYAALFSVCGTTFGSGDGTTTFNIPTYAQCVALFTGGHYHGGVTAGGANTGAAYPSTPSYGFFIIRTGVF